MSAISTRSTSSSLMPEPTSRGWRSCGRRESTSAASDPDPGPEPTDDTSLGGPLAPPGRDCRVLRARLLVRLLDSPHTGVETAPRPQRRQAWTRLARDRKSTRLNSSHLGISYAVF